MPDDKDRPNRGGYRANDYVTVLAPGTKVSLDDRRGSGTIDWVRISRQNFVEYSVSWFYDGQLYTGTFHEDELDPLTKDTIRKIGYR